MSKTRILSGNTLFADNNTGTGGPANEYASNVGYEKKNENFKFSILILWMSIEKCFVFTWIMIKALLTVSRAKLYLKNTVFSKEKNEKKNEKNEIFKKKKKKKLYFVRRCIKRLQKRRAAQMKEKLRIERKRRLQLERWHVVFAEVGKFRDEFDERAI